MSKQKKSRKLLKDLFSDLGQEAAQTPAEQEIVPGWTWECNAEGIFTVCSPEVEAVLGYAPQDFLGKRVSYRLATNSVHRLETALKSSDFLAEVILDYQGSRGIQVTVRAAILKIDSHEVGESRWRGICQVIETRAATPSLPPVPKQTGPLKMPQQESPTSLKSLGVAAEEDHTFSVSAPLTGLSAGTLAVPIEFPGQSSGLLEVLDENPQRQWSEDELQLVEEVADQLSLALENARLFQEEKRRRQIAATLSETARVVGATLELQKVGDLLLKQLSEAIEFYSASLQLLEGEQRTPISSLSKSSQSAPPAVTPQNLLIQAVVDSKQAVVVPDTRREPRWEDVPETEEIRSWIAAPLLNQDQVTGLLILEHSTPDTYDADTADLLSAIGAQVSVALRNASLFQQVQRRSVQLQTASEVSRAASSILEPNPLIQQTVNLIRERFDLYYVGLFIMDDTGIIANEPGSWAVLQAGTGEAGRIQMERHHKLEIGGGSMIGECIKTGKAQIPASIQDSTARFSNPLLPETKTEIALPLISRGETIGAMTIQSREENAFNEEDIAVLQTMSDQVANALQNANLFNQTQARAEELTVLNEMSQALSASLDPYTIVRNIYRYTSRLINTATFFVALYEPENKRVAYPIAIDENEEIRIDPQEPGVGLTGYVMDTGTPLLLTDGVEGLRSMHLDQTDPRLVGIECQSWLGVPLMVGNRAIGVINVQNKSAHVYDEHHRDLMIAIASQSAIAIQNAHLFEQTQTQAAELEILNEMSRVLSTLLDIDQIIPTIHEYTSRLMDTSYFFVALYDAHNDMVSFPYVVEKGKISRIPSMKKRQGLIQYVIDTKEPLLIEENVEQVIKDLGLEHINVGAQAESWLGVPLILGQEVMGVIATQNADQSYVFNAHHRDLLISIARQSAIAIQTARLFQATRRQTEDLAVLNEMSRVLTDLREIDQVLARVYEYTARLMDTNIFFIALYDEKNDEISMPLTIMDGERLEAPNRKLGEGLTDHVIRTGKPLLIEENVHEKLNELGIKRSEELPATLSWLGAPMILGEKCIGVISVQNPSTPRLYNERHHDLLISIASQAAISIQNARLFAQTQHQLADLTVIQATTSDLSEYLSFDDVSQSLLRHVVQAVGASSVTLFMLKPDAMVRMATYPAPEEDSADLGEEIPLADYPLTQAVIESRKPLSLYADDPRLQPHARETFKAAGISANATIPMVGPEGVLGVLSLSRMKPAVPFNDQEVNLVATLSNQAAVALENARLYEEQIKTSEQLRELDKLKSQFLANMSHELRTPLNSIIGFSRVIMKGIDGPITDLQQQDLSAIYNAGQHLLKMINDILDISKIDAGKMELAFEDVNISDVITSVLSTARGLVKDKPVKLVTEIEEGLPMINADSTRVRQVLLNLLSNAAKFTDDGSITVTARKQVLPDKKPEIYIAVTDTGIGISPEDQGKLFEAFVQVDGSPTRKTGGTGLGLSITRLLVELHGGEINMYSDVGKGSTFYFTLPIDQAAPPPPEIESGSNTVLSIDDDAQVLKLYERYLTDSGYQVISLTDPSRALEYARDIQPFVITLDIMLPNHDGWKLLEELKSDPATKDIPIVVCSILEEKEKGLSLGADEYLMKPILADDLIRVLQSTKNKILLTTEEVVP